MDQITEMHHQEALTPGTDGHKPSQMSIGKEQRSARLGYTISAPAFIVIAVVTLLPILFATYMSLTNVTTSSSGSLSFHWVGVTNYKMVLENSTVHNAILFTAAFSLASVVLGLIVGTGVALVLDQMSHGRGLVLAIMLLPYSMVTVIVAELWAYILNGVNGIANYFLVSVGIIHAPVTFLNTTAGAFVCLVIADGWKNLPFVTLIVLAGLRMLDRDLHSAAKIDGAGWFARLRWVTYPLIKPAVLTAAIFRTLQAFGVFDMVFVLTGGGPGNSTQSLAMLMYEELFENFSLGQGATISTITMVIVLIIAVSVMKVFRLQVSGRER